MVTKASSEIEPGRSGIPLVDGQYDLIDLREQRPDKIRQQRQPRLGDTASLAGMIHQESPDQHRPPVILIESGNTLASVENKKSGCPLPLRDDHSQSVRIT
ncbi:hypothetical protein D3C73_1054740 [compost metagenome]